MVPEQDIIKIYTEYIVPAIPFKEIPDEVDDEDRNNSNESSHSEDKEYNECLTDFKGYYEGYYLGKINERTGQRQKPVFPHSMWSKYDVVLAGADTTTNRSEGFNSNLKHRTARNPSVWTLIEQLKAEDGHIDNKVRH